MLKYTAEDNVDKKTIPKAVRIVREFLERVNVESGRTENRFNLLQLDQQLVFRQGEVFVSVSLPRSLMTSDARRTCVLRSRSANSYSRAR